MFTDFETFIRNVGYERIFRMLELRRVGDWTPFEMEKKYMDQDQYVSNHYTFIKIVEVIELPDKDYIIGYKVIFDWRQYSNDEEWIRTPIHYKKLSQMELSFYPDDMNEEDWD